MITGLSKAESAMLLLRGMNPQIIAMDEITQSADADAIREVCCCGVELLATAHARNADELRRRRVFVQLLGHRRVQLCAEHTRRGFGAEL